MFIGRFILCLTCFFCSSGYVSAQTLSATDSTQKINTELNDTLTRVVSSYYSDSIIVDSSIYYTDTIVQWLSIEKAMEMQAKSPKKIFMTIYASWCRWCRFMNDSIYTNKEIAHYMNSTYYPVKFNAEQKTPVTFKGKAYRFINEGDFYVNEFTLFMLNYRQSYPGFVFLNEEGNVINVRTSSMDVHLTETVLNYYGSNAYKNMSLRDFEEEFIGKIP